MKIQTPLKGQRSLATQLLSCILIVATLSARTVLADQPSEEEIAMCDSKESCIECLEAGVCDWYGSFCSHNMLMIADIDMYSIDPDSTIAQVCERAELREADQRLCNVKRDCASCTETILSDSVSTCIWNAEFDFCGPDFCTMMGCGVDTCADTAPPAPVVSTEPPISNEGEAPTVISCSSKTTCEECVAASGDGTPFCAWVPVFFYEHYPCTAMSCDTVADPNCFSRERDDRTPAEICPSTEPPSLTTETGELSESAAADTSSTRNKSAGLALIALLVSVL